METERDQHNMHVWRNLPALDGPLWTESKGDFEPFGGNLLGEDKMPVI